MPGTFESDMGGTFNVMQSDVFVDLDVHYVVLVIIKGNIGDVTIA